jgi:hypothetical protein
MIPNTDSHLQLNYGQEPIEEHAADLKRQGHNKLLLGT